MIDGTYGIMMQTPIGQVRGVLTLKTNGEQLSGILKAMGKQHPFSGGNVQGEACAFSSVFQTPLGTIPLSVKGTVHGDIFRATARTQWGMITATGKRVLLGAQDKE